MKAAFLFPKTWFLTAVFSAILALGTLVPGVEAQAESSEISWRLGGFMVETADSVKGRDRFSIRCNIVIGAGRFFLRPGGIEKVILTDRENNCLHLRASNLSFEIRNESRGPEGQRYFDVRVVRHEVVSSLRMSELAGGFDEFLAIEAQKRLEGIVPIKYDEGFLTAKDRIYFGRIISDQETRMECRQYVQTVAGVVNPVGLRTLECHGVSKDPLRVGLLFVDTSLWLR